MFQLRVVSTQAIVHHFVYENLKHYDWMRLAYAKISRVMSEPAQVSKKSPRLILLGVGTILTSMVLSGFLLGYWVDSWLDTKPVFMLLFAGLGFVGAAIRLCKLLVS